MRSDKKGAWEQYVGRRVVRYGSGDNKYYLAWAGNKFAGKHELLGDAQVAAESIQG